MYSKNNIIRLNPQKLVNVTEKYSIITKRIAWKFVFKIYLRIESFLFIYLFDKKFDAS